VYGGEYASLGMHMKRIISVWRSVGIRVTVVFDGASKECYAARCIMDSLKVLALL
jgi:hypothetical protein